ncbi:MAG: DUF4175 domain-containing protein [Candidatus Cloacimonetes bacterium]|nr:DUF4175 domain-containing protein [Candidatus Cloacimonadota bacterium]
MRKFEKKIVKLRKSQNLVTTSRYLILAIALFLIIQILFYGLYQANLGRLPQFYTAFTLKVLLIMGLLFMAVSCMRAWINDREAAALLDRYNHDKQDTYQNAWELLHLEKQRNELIELVLFQADKKSESQEIKADRSPLKSIWQIATAIAITLLMIFIFDSRGLADSISYFQQMKLPPEQHKAFVEVIPGNIAISRGSDLLVEVLNAEAGVEHRLLWKREKIWREEVIFENRKRFENLDHSLSYCVKTPYAVSDTFQVDVYDLPVVQEYNVKYDYPAYTGMKGELLQKASGHLKALSGTDITLSIKANNPIDTALVVFDDGAMLRMDRQGKSDFQVKFELEKNGFYRVNLQDFLGNMNDRVEKTMTAIPDAYPEIVILSPGRDTLLDQNMLLPLSIRATDDYGLQNLKLKYYINNEAEDSLIVQKDITGSAIELEYIFNLNDIWLIPGDRLNYWLEITDNTPWGQTTRSERYIARFPSISEIYAEIEAEEEAKTNYLEKLSEDSELLQKDFEEKRRELMKKEDYDWEDKKDLENLMQKQEELSENVENMAESYQDLVDKMQNNQALSQETLEKMQRIQELMEEISSDEMKQAMEDMQKAMENMDPEMMQKAMENMKFSMEDFSQQIDQTLKLLEDIKKEQTMQKALEIAEEMEKMQSDLNERTEEGSESSEKLAEEQQQQQDKLAELQKQMEEALALLDPQKDSKVQEQMQNLMESGMMDSLDSDISSASQKLQQQEMSQAQQSQQNAMSKMQRLRSHLENMSSMMSMSGSMDIAAALDVAIRSFIFMSRQQQNISSSYARDPFIILPDLIAEFEGINLALQKLYAVPMIVLALGPKFVYDVNYTMAEFRELFQYINDAKSGKVAEYLLNIQKGINMMIYDLMQSSQNMQQGGGGGGMQSLMQQLQQMSEQQMMMNMMTQQIYQQMMQGGKPSQQMLQEMRRLAEEEERLAENLKRSLQNNPEAQKQTSSINKMIEDLEGISRNLKRGKIDQDLIDTQERILSRLLDAQKSIHKRDFSKKRKAETSDFLDWDTPEEIQLKFDKLRQKALLEENYQNYPQEYQELIREYLKRLNSE